MKFLKNVYSLVFQGKRDVEILHQDLELITKMESLLVCICKSSFCTSVLEHGALILDFVADEVL